MEQKNGLVALVGHCGPDSWMLKSMVSRALPGYAVELINDDDSLARALTDGASLLLVNRVLDGRFSTDSGIDLIRSHTGDNAPPMMLISNFEDAQAEAQAAGALPGFGKAAVNRPETVGRLRDAVGVS